ncbi:MAG: hypothetical protein COA44_07615 [Arcobacter sp.]|nr:MAG: hypothetical protein COA44_07615 [Arcobacter sp.]
MHKLMALISLFVLSSSLMAADCVIDSFSVNWTAFKTPTKIGVSGTFAKPNLETRQTKDLCFFSFLPTTTVHIDTSSVKTDNETRDRAIVNAFFKNMIEGKYIDAIIKRVDLERKELSVEITMNDVTQTIYMPYIHDDKMFRARGKIDILNFSASKALNALNEVCFEKHKGKTWSEVELSFVIVMKNSCK